MEGAYEDEIQAGLHTVRYGDLPLDSIIAQSVPQAFVQRLLTYAPGNGLEPLLALVEAPADADVDVRTNQRGLGGTPFSGERYLFVSYAHADSPRLDPLVSRITAAGNRLWWDAAIPGGSEWDEFIEEKIRASSALLLFVSNAAVASRYVRREVKFADVIGKRILAVDLERDVPLRHGLHMLLSQYQRLRADAPDLLERIQGSLRFLGDGAQA